MPFSEQKTDGFAVTPDDDEDLAKNASALFVGEAGTLRVTTVRGTVLNFAAVPAGSVIPLAVKRVHATGTSADSIVGLY